MQDNTNNISGAAVYGSPATKKSISVPMVIVTLIAIAGVVCAVIFGIMAFSKNKDANTAANNTTTNTSANTSAESTTTTPQGTNVENVTIEENNVTVAGANAAILAVNASKIVNPTENAVYEFTTAMSGGSGDASLSISTSDPKVATVGVSWDKMYEYFNTNSTKTTGYDNYTVTFDQPISDIRQGIFGQSALGKVFFVIMEDGTLKYSFMSDIAKTGTVNFQDVPGISNVIKTHDVSLHFQIGGYATTLAQTVDGSLYDLANTLDAFHR